MMPSPVALDAPPAQPPEVQAGGPKPPMAGVGGMLADKGGAAGAEGKGAAVTAVEAAIKVLNNVSTMAQEMGPYVARAVNILKSGIEMMAGGKPGIQSAGGAGNDSAKPQEMGAGQGFPG